MMNDLAQEVAGSVVKQSHLAAWNTGMLKFGVADDPPRPRALLIGEAPGPNTNALLPLFPNPGSAGARLFDYSGISMADWLGKLVRVNLCDGTWSARRAVAGRARALAFLFDKTNYHDGSPLRVLLLGAKVARAWGCYGPFGHVSQLYYQGPTLRVAWIPHPSGKNLIYNARSNQLRARRAVLWAIGERDKP